MLQQLRLVSWIGFSTLFLLATTACVGPLVLNETGRTVGQGQNEFSAGYGTGGLAFKWSHGVTEDFDLGVQWESLALGARAKYSFLNESEGGFSAAGAIGIGDSLGGYHYYADLIGSYLSKPIESYMALRWTQVTIDDTEYRDSEGNISTFIPRNSKFSYGLLFLGSRVWFADTWMVSIEAALLFNDKDLDTSGNLIFNAALGTTF